MENEAYPVLFRQADIASKTYQDQYLWLIRGEYALLIVASIISISHFSSILPWRAPINFFSLLIFVGSLVLLLYRSLRKPEQDWYRSRALAESIKTLTWRYMMRAHPFHEDESGTGHRTEFHENVNRVFQSSNIQIVAVDLPSNDENRQITSRMDFVRALPLTERLEFYLENRVAEQHSWYRVKANDNRRKAKFWLAVSVFAYAIALCLVTSRSVFHFQEIPVDPVIVLCSCILGWVQTKKFNELAAVYTVTAHEIGMVNSIDQVIETDDQFAHFVNDAELVFSREHTSWVARNAR